MTREEAIKIIRKEIECLSHSKCEDCILEKTCDPMRTPLDSEYIEAFEISIKALEQESCEDAISREGTASFLQDIINDIPKNKEGKYNSEFAQYVNGLDRAITIIKFVMPPVTPQPKTGHWIDVDGIFFKCSECGAYRKMMPAYKEYYCPNCGAKMEEGD